MSLVQLAGKLLCSELLASLLLVSPGSHVWSQEGGTSAPEAPPAAAAPIPRQAFRLGSGDLLEVKVFGVPELSQDARINSVGEINMPLVGTIVVAGLTEEQAQAVIENRLRDSGLMKDPHVTVLAKDLVSQGVSVLGEVGKPGIYPLAGSRRLLDAISAAGGTTQRAGRIVTITHRDDPEHPLRVELDNDPGKAPSANIELQPGDTVVVLRAGVVYVVGDVGRPSGLVMDNNEQMSVLQAIALAGGTLNTASLKGTRILRKTSTGIKEIPVPLKPILSAKSEDVPLQANDILFVPGSKSKAATRRGIDSIVGIATGLALVRP